MKKKCGHKIKVSGVFIKCTLLKGHTGPHHDHYSPGRVGEYVRFMSWYKTTSKSQVIRCGQ